MPEVLAKVSNEGGFDASLRRAREFEAAHYEAHLAIRDAAHLRLESLKADLAPLVASHARARDYFDLAIAPTDPMRLWIDLLASVTLEPDPRTYRLSQDLPSGRAVLLETAERAEMVEKVKDYMAHRLVERDRAMAGARPLAVQARRFSRRALALAGLGGFAAGAGSLLLLFILLKKLHF